MPAFIANRKISIVAGLKKQLYFANEGAFTSPNYPTDYPNDIFYSYQIKGIEGNNITVDFPELHLEDHDSCYYDYVSVSEF